MGYIVNDYNLFSTIYDHLLEGLAVISYTVHSYTWVKNVKMDQITYN